jgi:hypothetical protein
LPVLRRHRRHRRRHQELSTKQAGTCVDIAGNITINGITSLLVL